MLTHAYHPRNPQPIALFSVADEIRVHQRNAANPAIFGPSVAKKPHVRVNGRLRHRPATFLRGIAAPTWWKAPPTETSMTCKGLTSYDTSRRRWTLSALALVLWMGSPAFAADE